MAVTKEDVFYSQQRPEILAAKINALGDVDNLGDITTLTTTAKTTAVAAINEIDASVTTAEALLASSLAQIMTFEVAALTAGSDITAQTLAALPTGYSFEIISADIIANGSSVGIDAANTCIVAVKNGANTVVTKTYNDAVVFPADNAVSNLGAISAAYKTVAAGALLSLAVTNGTTAATPKFKVQITGKLIKAA